MLTRLPQIMKRAVILLAVSVFSPFGISLAATAPVPVVTTLAPVTNNLNTPVRIAQDGKGNFFVTDPRSGGVSEFNAFGKLVSTIRTAVPPQGVAVMANGNLVVTFGNYAAIIDPTGKEVARLGQGVGQFKQANGVAIDAAGNIYVADSLNNCVQVFDANGNPVTTGVALTSKPVNSFGYGINEKALGDPGILSYPTGVTYEKQYKQIVVTSTPTPTSSLSDVTFFNVSDYKLAKVIGYTNVNYPVAAWYTYGMNPLQFMSPQGVTFEYDASGNAYRMYVVDTLQSKIQAIDPNTITVNPAPLPPTYGTYLSYIGSYGTVNGQLVMPADAVFDQANKRLVVVNGAGDLTIYGIDGGSSPTDTTAPVVTINPVTSPVSTPTVALSGTVSDQNLDKVVVTSTTGALAGPVTVNGTTWSTTVSMLAPGNNTITVTATDAAGNSTSVGTVVAYLLPAPALTVNSISALTTVAAQTLTGTVDAGATVTVTNSVTSASGTAMVTGTTWTYPTTLVEGVNSFTVSASLPGSAVATRSTGVTLDTIPPVLTVSALPNGSYTSTQTQNVSGTATDLHLASVSVNGQAVVVTNGAFSSAVQLVPGANTIVVTAIDAAGNAATDTRTINFSATAPVISIVSPADNAYTNKSSIVITGSVDKTATVKVAGVPVTVDPTTNGWTATVDLQAGLNTVDITATDLYGNTSSMKRTVTLDTANPVLAITDPIQDISTNKPNYVISGTVKDDASVSLAATVNGVTTPVAVTAGSYSFNVDFPQEGTYAVTLTATDAAGNVSSATRTLISDLTPPALTVTPSAAYQPTSLSGTVEAGASVVVDQADQLLATATVSGTAWSADLSGVNYDPTLLKVVATDAAGNTTVKGLTYQYPDGDLDGDGTVTMADALVAIRIVVNNTTPTAQQLAHGDIGPLLSGKPNPNGKIDLVDALLILRKALGLKSW